jgi:hypothetical protein
MTRRSLFATLAAAVALPWVPKAAPLPLKLRDPQQYAKCDAANVFEALRSLRKNYKDAVGRYPDFYLTNWRGQNAYYNACITDFRCVNNLLMENQMRGLDYAGAPIVNQLMMPLGIHEHQHYRVRSIVYVSDGEKRWYYYACELTTPSSDGRALV